MSALIELGRLLLAGVIVLFSVIGVIMLLDGYFDGEHRK